LNSEDENVDNNNNNNNNLSVEDNNESTENLINEPTDNNFNMIRTLSLKEFKSHVPEWGGNIRFQNNYITLSDTCTIDYYLFSMWVIYKQNTSILEGFKLFDSEKYRLIQSIISNIEKKYWDKAKELWVLKIMNYDISSLNNNNNNNNNISLFGSEDMMFIQYIRKYQEYRLIQKCRQKCKKNNTIYRWDANYIFFKKFQDNLMLFYGYDKKCSSCGHMISSEVDFTYNPTFLFIEPANQNTFINELPKTVEINGKIFKLLCATIHTELADGHFVGIFNFNDEMLVVDDLTQSVKRLNQDRNNYSEKPVSGSLYVL
jgi:hypothetical protein